MYYVPALRAARVAPRFNDRAFERFAQLAFASAQRSLQVDEDEAAWTLSLDVPGLSRENITVDIEDATVRLASAADAPRRLSAAYRLPGRIDAAQSAATLENGVLKLRLVKAIQAPKAVKIAVQ